MPSALPTRLPFRADDDGLLTVALDNNGGVNADELREFFPFIDHDVNRVRNFLLGGLKNFLADQLRRKEPGRLIGDMIRREIFRAFGKALDDFFACQLLYAVAFMAEIGNVLGEADNGFWYSARIGRSSSRDFRTSVLLTAPDDRRAVWPQNRERALIFRAEGIATRQQRRQTSRARRANRGRHPSCAC